MEAGVGVQPCQLARHRCRQPGMGMADTGDVVHHVQVGPRVGIDESGPPAPFDPGRVGVVVLLNARDMGLALGQ